MMRSLYSGVSGLQNHQTRMDVIGNNIANVNTFGFKRARVNFQDMISQQLSGPARPNDELGGVNPKEVGLGMTIASVDNIFTQGNLQTTGVTTDIAIEGNGFFILKDGEQSYYTRNGDFSLDRDGTFVNPANGMRVQGWMAQEVNGIEIVSTAATPTDIVIPVGSKDPPRATQNVLFRCNLDKNTPLIPEQANAEDIIRGTWGTEQEIYDSFGQSVAGDGKRRCGQRGLYADESRTQYDRRYGKYVYRIFRQYGAPAFRRRFCRRRIERKRTDFAADIVYRSRIESRRGR